MIVASWYQPAHWPLGQQWLLLLLSSSLLMGGLALGLAPRWQQYQRLVSAPYTLLPVDTAPLPGSLSPPTRSVVTVIPTVSATTSAGLLQQISSLIEQQDLALVAWQQPAMTHPEGTACNRLTVAVVGGYQELLNFLMVLDPTLYPWTIDTLLLQREEQSSEVKLTLELSLTETPEAL